jgi:hypothetical protein
MQTARHGCYRTPSVTTSAFQQQNSCQCHKATFSLRSAYARVEEAWQVSSSTVETAAIVRDDIGRVQAVQRRNVDASAQLCPRVSA